MAISIYNCKTHLTLFPSSIEWPSWPIYSDKDFSAVESVIKSNQLFAASKVKSFESEFAAYIGTQHAVAVGNATQGLHLALAALGIGWESLHQTIRYLISFMHSDAECFPVLLI